MYKQRENINMRYNTIYNDSEHIQKPFKHTHPLINESKQAKYCHLNSMCLEAERF